MQTRELLVVEPLRDYTRVIRPAVPQFLLYAEFGLDKNVHPFAPSQPQPQRAVFAFGDEFEGKERAAEPFTGNEFRDQKNSGLLRRKAEGISVGQLLHFF